MILNTFSFSLCLYSCYSVTPLDGATILRDQCTLTWNCLIHVWASSIDDLVSWSVSIHGSGVVLIVVSQWARHPCKSEDKIVCSNRFNHIWHIRWYSLEIEKPKSAVQSAFYLKQNFLWQSILQTQRRGSGQRWPQTECPAHWWVQPLARPRCQTRQPHTELFWPSLHGEHGQFSHLKSKRKYLT